MVRDARSGTTLYQHNPRTRLVPASNLKLLTTAAAMDVLGPDYRFSTQLLSDGRRQGEGTMTYASGEEAEGEWRDGALAPVPVPTAATTADPDVGIADEGDGAADADTPAPPEPDLPEGE